MKKLSIAALAAASLVTTAFVSANPATAGGTVCHMQKGASSGFTSAGKACFEFEGRVWTITDGPAGVPITRVGLLHDFHLACPQLAVKVEPQKKFWGPAFAGDQKVRNDFRMHPLCDRSVPIPGLADQQPPAQAVPPASQPQVAPRS